MKRVRKGAPLERLYPIARGRAAADRATDELDPRTTTLADAMQAWDEAYYQATGQSPFRDGEP